MYNPSVSQEPRYEPAAVIPVKEDTSLIDWLKETNRFIPREKVEEEDKSTEDVDLADFIENEDNVYEDDSDDDMDLDDED